VFGILHSLTFPTNQFLETTVLLQPLQNSTFS